MLVKIACDTCLRRSMRYRGDGGIDILTPIKAHPCNGWALLFSSLLFSRGCELVKIEWGRTREGRVRYVLAKTDALLQRSKYRHADPHQSPAVARLGLQGLQGLQGLTRLTILPDRQGLRDLPAPSTSTRSPRHGALGGGDVVVIAPGIAHFEPAGFDASDGVGFGVAVDERRVHGACSGSQGDVLMPVVAADV